ncbi:hypothetical protein HHK36_013569 [Tetracentron sinense]|uniref:IBH1-like N-terminal domain-containing protein n=1 Tax=Tetracentron sinense TaxID=13715 RepID=A0A834Z6I7_TETSI|nr:hypothetical protein HHK36_013569 [Tetracentron sinense]
MEEKGYLGWRHVRAFIVGFGVLFASAHGRERILCTHCFVAWMEGQKSKRMRTYSFEPCAVLRAVFPRKYVNHLLPALVKISSKRLSSDENDDYKREKIVRFEVDMALVLSAERFGWSRALKQKLERDLNVRNLGNAPTLKLTSTDLLTYRSNGAFMVNEKVLEGILQYATIPSPMLPLDLPQIPNSKPNSEKPRRSKRVQCRRRRIERNPEGGEEEQFSCRLKSLRMLLPGGNEMGEPELLSEMESYIVCLELQVSILRSLVDTY